MKIKLEEILGKVFGADPKKINDKTSPQNLAGWDSFNGLVLIKELEKNFKIKLNFTEMSSIKNVADIKKVLRKHKITDV